jgi:hypothetical protein
MAGSFSSFGVLLLLLAGGGFIGSSDVVPLPEDPVVAQVAPEECLFYASWTGKTQASPDATSSTELLFSNPEFLAYLQHVEGRLSQFINQGVAAAGLREQQVQGWLQLLGHLHTHAGSFYVSKVSVKPNQPPEVLSGVVVRVEDADLDTIAAALENILQGVPAAMRLTTTVGETQFTGVDAGGASPPIRWGILENYLVVCVGEGEAEKMVARFGGSVPAWLLEAKRRVATPRPARFVHLNIQRLFATMQGFMEPSESAVLTEAVTALGFDALESFSYGSGLDDQGTVAHGLFQLAGELSGMLTLLDCEPLESEDFQYISSTSPAAVLVQLNLADVLTAFMGSSEHRAAPPGLSRLAKEWQQTILEIRSRVGIDAHKDLLASLGTTWRLYVQPGSQPLTEGWVLSVDLVNSAKFTSIQDQLLNDFQQKTEGGPVRVVSQENAQAVFHSVQLGGSAVVPTWAVYQDRLWITTSTAAMQRLLTPSGPEESLAAADQVSPFLQKPRRTLSLLHLDMAEVIQQALPLLAQQVDSLPPGVAIDSSFLPPLEILAPLLQPTVIALERTEAGVAITSRGTLPGINPGPVLPLLVGAILPSANSNRAQSAAHRSQSMNNLRQIGLALHNFQDSHKALPAGYSADEEGQPLLSWRVYLLPYFDQQALYNQFHLDEPWDSPHNKRLIAQMPDVYRSPHSQAEQGHTTYLGVGGADGVFVRPEDGNYLGVSFRQITDGTSLTVMTVEASDDRAIVWTRPGDFAPLRKDPQQGLRVDRRWGLSLGFADGSLRNVPPNIAKEKLHALFTKSGGERVELP